ncbi:BTB/POZ domain-containing protein 3-like isoform X2 [Stegodyphus dumicola]|uniref:BTB/POZ domain-containing protein 3-like isoform X2 n=1 Tax=Stegodyphus dumicola TaxID=202533 RepID=UPI0015B2A8C2|nr:BTB/POZ domain-containing protein 3-like isoform X2 [Stegodyphus dumicola]
MSRAFISAYRNMSHLLRPPSFCSAGELLYLNEELKDLYVVVQTDASRWQFPAHALVLSAESSVFRELLEGETSEDRIREIVIDNITPSTMEQLLRYLYCGKLEVETWSEGIDLLQAAFKYKVEGLVQKCGRFLEDVVSLSNVCYIYDKASAFSLPVLQDKCLRLILDAGFIVLRSSAFKTLSKDCVIDIVASSDLNIDSELVVFETLLRWAQLECCRSGQAVTEANILQELKPFLQHVCVDDMSDADKSALPPSVLSCVKPNNRNRIGFSVQESLLLYSQRLEFEAHQTYYKFVGDNLSCLRFSVDAPIYLIGLRFTLLTSDIPFQLPLTLVKENTPKMTMFSNLTPAIWVQSLLINQRIWHETEVLLRQPVLLKAGDVHNLYLTNVSADTQCPKMILTTRILRTACGNVNFSIHGEEMYGITCLIMI